LAGCVVDEDGGEALLGGGREGRARRGRGEGAAMRATEERHRGDGGEALPGGLLLVEE